MTSKAKRLSAFDLDELREAFKKSVREQEQTPIDWEECAKQFLERAIQGGAERFRRFRINR
ncbi:hypothetical protein [Mesorhizobium sp. WSM4884]|uniref:hypothetical protein n=1 Tax=Mesorhizobium sp. WSM4884 TaxID=3038542 RepID=UPI0024173E23|nr:hypothetical protein [Mesorhizobium sp. WSM4884]MDG4881966.1 hypothetical protein [Mesorhizobium sp. WSM4884]